MREKTITIVLTILLLLVTMIVVPSINKLVPLLLGGGILLVLLLANYKKFTIDKKDILILIFAILIFVSTMLSGNVKNSIIGEQKRYEGMLSLFSYIVIYFSAKKFLNYKNKKILLGVFYIIYISICTLGLLQYYIKIPNISLFNKGIIGTFGNTNFMGSFLSIGLPVFTIMYITKNSKISLLVSALAFFCLIACEARSAWVAISLFSIFLLIYLLKQKNKEFFKRAIVLLIIFVIIFMHLFTVGSNFVKRKINTTLKDTKVAITQGINKNMGSGRIHIWNITIDLVKKYPFFGVGPDNLKYGLANNGTEEYIEYIKNYNSIIDKAHNEYLQIAVTIGIPALTVYCTFLFFILYEKRKLIYNNLLVFIIYSSILCYMIQAFFNISIIRNCSVILVCFRINRQ